MLIDYALSQTGIIVRVKLRQDTTGGNPGNGITALTSASSGLIISTIADNEATPTAYTSAGSTIETITTLGTYATPTATKCRFKLVDNTNHPGIYEIQIADARYAVSSSKSLLIGISGVTGMSNCDVCIPLRSVNPYDAVRFGMTSLPNAVANATGGLFAGVVRGGTAQAGAGTTITLDASASSTNDFYKGCLIYPVSGTGANQGPRTIITYGGGNKVATVDRAWATNPNNTTVFVIIPANSPALTTALAVTAAVSKVVIFSGTAQTGSTSNTIKLSAAASATNNLYNGDLLSTTGGTGAGQTKTIISYNGTTKVATVDKAWVTIPDNTTTFDIYANTTPSLFSDQGVLQSATSSTATLAATASAVNNIYNGSLLTILSGTDSGDTAEITAYNGSTKVITISGTFALTPDTTSAYAIIPTDSGSGSIGGTQDVNVISWGGTAVSVNTAGVPRVDLVSTLGTAVTLDTNSVLNVSTKYINGTLQTARDIGLSVLLAANQHVVVDSGTVTNLSNLPTAPTDWLTAAAVSAAAVTKIQTGLATPTNITLATGVTLATSQTFNNTGTWTGNIVGTLSTLTTYTGNTVQTGDSFARIGAAGAGLTAVGDTAGTTMLLSRLTSARAGYLDNLNVGGAVASQADVQAVNASASKHLLITTVGQYERPESGTTTYTVEVRTFAAATGAAVNADSTPTLTATGQTSGSLSANLSVAANPATGVYRWTYAVLSSATQEPVRFDVSATIASSTFTLSTYTQVVDMVSATWTATDATHLTSIYNKLPVNNIADETLILAQFASGVTLADGPHGGTSATLALKRMVVLPTGTDSAVQLGNGLSGGIGLEVLGANSLAAVKLGDGTNGTYGLEVHGGATTEAVFIDSSASDAVSISANRDAINLNAGRDGISVASAGRYGVFITSHDTAFYLVSVVGYGINDESALGSNFDNGIRADIDGDLLGSINGLTATALSKFFTTNSGTTYVSAVAGSVVKEIASNPSAVTLADGSISDATFVVPPDGTGQATGIVSMLLWLYNRFFGKSKYNKVANTLETFQADGTTVRTTQNIITNATTDEVDRAS